jgi:hypothetical protein
MPGDATNKELLAALRQKLGDVSPQAISQRRMKIKRLVDMPTDVATYIVAHRERLRISKWLGPEKLREVAEFEEKLMAKERVVEQPASGTRRPSRGAAQPAKVTRNTTIGGKVKIPSGALNPTHVAEARRMAETYPLLYVFENSVREFLDGHLRAAFGDDWHLDTKIVNTDTRRRVERNKAAEDATRYHSRRNERFIYYTDITDLPLIVESTNGWKVFKKDLPSTTWLKSIIERIEPSRHVVAHMNPIRPRDTRRIEDALADWLDQTKDRQPPT